MLRSLLRSSWLAVFTVGCLSAFLGCRTATEIRIQNVSTLDYTEVSVAGQSYGNIAAGTTYGYAFAKRANRRTNEESQKTYP